MIPLPPRSTRTDTLFPYTTLFRSATNAHEPLWNAKFVAPGARQRQICRGASALLLVEPICELAFRHVQHLCRFGEVVPGFAKRQFDHHLLMGRQIEPLDEEVFEHFLVRCSRDRKSTRLITVTNAQLV